MDDVKNINFGFLGGNLMSDWDTTDKTESCRRFAELCEKDLQAAFPDADIEVNYEVNASGSLPSPLKARVNHDPEDPRCATIEEVTNKVWESWLWVVETSTPVRP